MPEMNVPNAIVDCQVRLAVIERHIDYLHNNNPNLKKPNAIESARIVKEAKQEVMNKYPGLTF